MNNTLVKVSKKDRRIILKGHNRGYSAAEILDRYTLEHEYTVQQIAAIKAHGTMGTY
jgi:hypothetical protein